MDKELLRIVIIATGLLVIVGMIVWASLKGKNARRRQGLYDDGEIVGKIDKSLILNTQHDDFDIIPVRPLEAEEPAAANSADFPDESDDFTGYEGSTDDDDEEPPPRFVAPEIIQFSIIAKDDHGFNGIDLINAFEVAGLDYGPLKIYERLDGRDQVLFRIANLVSPGTFPEDNPQSFHCPGIVCFMQPAEVEDAASVFEDYIETVELLAVELDGNILDHQRQPLNPKTIELIRQSL